MVRIGFALGSGGARGLAHIGVLSVLEKAGIRPHCIAGTSMGAIIGALYAECLDSGVALVKMKEYIEDPKIRASWDPFLDSDQLREERNRLHEFVHSLQKRILTFKAFTSPALQSPEKLREPLRGLLQTERIEDLPVSFACIAVDLISGRPHVFREGNLVDAIYASSAIPGVFPPVRLKDELLIDGGGPYRVPVEVCRELGAEFVIALDIPSGASQREEYRTGMDILMRSDAITRERLNRHVLDDADVVISPDVARFHWANFAAGDEIRSAGEVAAESVLPVLRAKLGARSGLSGRLRNSLSRILGRRR